MKQMKSMTTDARPYFRFTRVIRFIPAVAWMIVIFLLSSRTGDELGTVLPLLQKYLPFMSDFNWGHFVAYFILAMTIDYGIGSRADRLGMKLLIVMLCGLYGVSDEIHQSFVAGRMMDIMDIRNDMIGATLWVLLVMIPPIRRTWRRLAT